MPRGTSLIPNRPGERRGGRAKGTPNKTTGALKEMILGALDEAGAQAYLVRVATENPAAFMTLLGKVLPTTLAGDKDSPMTALVIERRIVNPAGRVTSREA